MSRTIKRTTTVLLSVIMLTTIFTALPFTANAANTIQFGSYPQSEVKDADVLSALNALEPEWQTYDYYIEKTKSDYMQYCDVTLGEEKYRGVTFSQFRPDDSNYAESSEDTSYQDDNGYYTGNVYWFKYEPITWRILDREEGLVMAEIILDSQAFEPISNSYVTVNNKKYYPSNFYCSSIRAWLNNDFNNSFYNTAFSEEQKSSIKTTHVDVAESGSNEKYNSFESDDKVYLLSKEDLSNSDYGFSSEQQLMAKGSDYAKSQGLYVSRSGYSRWWERSPWGWNSLNFVNFWGSVSDSQFTHSTCIGVRPVCKIEMSEPATEEPTTDPTEPSTTKSGTTGDCTWTLDDEGTLTVSGNGKMEDYFDEDAPWGDQITSVVINNGVTSIGERAFYDCAELTDVTIPGSVTSIGNEAFAGCTGLTDVDIPDSVKTIGAMAFSDCTGLTSVNIPDGVKNIAFQTFCNCSNLTDITIPASVTSVGYEAFTGCTELSGVYISDLAAWCGISFSDMAANPLSNAHKLYLNKELVTDLAIPESVTGIGNYAFSGNTELTSVTIPDTVTSIGDWAFSDCTGLTSVTIGNGVTEIGRYTFEGCTGLTGVTIPETVTTIGEKAFGYYYADDEYNKLADFTIYGKKGSAAEAYANENGFKFVDDAKPLVGDVNGDDVVNGADAGVLNRYASGWTGYADKIKNMTAADINNDGKVNGADAGILSRYVSGWTQYARFFES